MHNVTLSHIHNGYTSSEQPVQAPNSSVWCCLSTPKQPWMQMQRSSFTHTSVIRAYCQLYYCEMNLITSTWTFLWQNLWNKIILRFFIILCPTSSLICPFFTHLSTQTWSIKKEKTRVSIYGMQKEKNTALWSFTKTVMHLPFKSKDFEQTDVNKKKS